MKAKIIDALLLFLFYWVFYLVVMSLMMAFILFVGSPIIVFLQTGVWVVVGIDFIFKAIKSVLFAATSVSIILWVSSFVFPEDTKTKKYWWNKEINKKD